jgi:hypothetical protein
MPNTLRVLDFFASLHLTIFERPACFEFFNNQISPASKAFFALDRRKTTPAGPRRRGFFATRPIFVDSLAGPR